MVWSRANQLGVTELLPLQHLPGDKVIMKTFNSCDLMILRGTRL